MCAGVLRGLGYEGRRWDCVRFLVVQPFRYQGEPMAGGRADRPAHGAYTGSRW